MTTDQVAGTLHVLDAYTESTLVSLAATAEALNEAIGALGAVREAASDITVEVHDPGERLQPVLELLEVIDRIPRAVAWALSHLDAGMQPGGVGPPSPTRSAVDGNEFEELVVALVNDDLIVAAEHGTFGGPSGAEQLGLSIATVMELAKGSPEALDDLLRDVRFFNRVRPAGTWPWWVTRSGTPVGLVVAGYEDWSRTAADELATTGERAASAASAVAVEGGGAAVFGAGGAAAGAKIGATVGSAGGPIGVGVGLVLGSVVGATAGSIARDTRFAHDTERDLARVIDQVAGTGREPDRYDELLER